MVLDPLNAFILLVYGEVDCGFPAHLALGLDFCLLPALLRDLNNPLLIPVGALGDLRALAAWRGLGPWAT